MSSVGEIEKRDPGPRGRAVCAVLKMPLASTLCSTASRAGAVIDARGSVPIWPNRCSSLDLIHLMPWLSLQLSAFTA